MPHPLTSIVILTLNELEYTRRCVESIARCTPEPHELVFVDNGSTDGTVDYLRSIDGAIVIANGENLGFGGGCNQGIAASSGARVLLLNNDTVVTPGWLNALHRALDADRSRGIVGPRSNNVADRQRIDDVGYDEWTLDGLEEWSAARTAATPAGSGFAMPRIIGFCMLTRREVLDAIGGFDVRFGLGNFEDDDLCLRAAVAGYSSWVADDAFVHHFGSRTFIGTGTHYSASMNENWRKFAAKWGLPPVQGDGKLSGYEPGPILQRTRYDLARHYAPLVAVPYDDATVELERRGTALLIAALPHRHDELEAMFRACCEHVAAADDVTVVVRIDPADDAAFAVLDRVADQLGDRLPDVAVVPARARNDEAVVRACDLVLCDGTSGYALAGIARLHGVATASIDDLRERRLSLVSGSGGTKGMSAA